MYVKETYIPVRRRKRKKRFPVDMIEEGSFYLFNALSADSIKKYKAGQKCDPEKKKRNKLQDKSSTSKQTVDVKILKENRKKDKKRETKKKDGGVAVKKYKFFQPEVKTFSDVTFSPNTTFDRLLHSSRRPLAEKNSELNSNNEIKSNNSALLSPNCPTMGRGCNRTSTPNLISPIFPTVKVRNIRRRNVNELCKDERKDLLTSVLRNSIESSEKSSGIHSVMSPCDSIFSNSPLLCRKDDSNVLGVLKFFPSGVHNSNEAENLGGEFVAAHKSENSSLSPIAMRRSSNSSTANENINYKITHSQDSSESFSTVKMRLRRRAATENKECSNTNSSFNCDESFFSSVTKRHKNNKKTENRCNKGESSQSSNVLLSPVVTRSTITCEVESVHKRTIEVQECVENFCSPLENKNECAKSISAHNYDERSQTDVGYNKSKRNYNVDKSIPSTVKVKHKRSGNRYYTRSSDHNHERYLSPFVKSSLQPKNGSNCVNTTCDGLKCAQIRFTSPDMFVSGDEIETLRTPSKFVTVVDKYNSNVTVCNSNDEDDSGGNVSSSSVATDCFPEYHKSCVSNSTHSLVRETEFSHSISSSEIKNKSIPSSVKVKYKRSGNRYHTRSSDHNHERCLSPFVRSSLQHKNGSNCANTTSDGLKCAQIRFTSPDMFVSGDEIETLRTPSKFVTVVDKYNSNVTVCNSNDKNGSGGNVSSSSVATDCSPEHRKSCASNSTHSLVRETEFSHSISSSEIKNKSDAGRKSIVNNMTLTSHVSSTPNLTTPVHADHSDNYVVNGRCDQRNELLKAELDSDISVRATASEVFMAVTPEVNQFSRTKKSTYSLSVPSHIETCSPSHNETCTVNVVPQVAHQEEELKDLSSVLSGTADIHELDDCKGRSLTHGMSVCCEEKSLCNISRRSSICRRLSHVIIPDRRARGSSNSNGSLPMPEKRSGFLSVSVIIEDEELDPDDDVTLTQALGSARNMVLGRCNQSEPLTFEKAFPPRFFENCKKIGEGLYGEVFFCQYDCTPGRVLKIIPIEGHILVNGEKQKKFNEVQSELVIAMELSDLRHDAQFKTNCFVEVARCVCVKGKYPQRLIELWNAYHEEKVSENDSPTIFDDSQHFLIFELADGGKALENYCFSSAAQAFSAFVQLTFALAVAEITLEFEHRDLHWGNVLIKKTPSKHITFKLNGKEFLVPANGIQVTVIDYTLSRMSYGGCCIFNDLAVDPDLFISEGDYQFEVYRLMQKTVKNEWNHFKPYTNILWLHYILGKMLHGVHYKNISTKIHKKFKTKLTDCFNNVQKYNSAYEYATSGSLLEMMK